MQWSWFSYQEVYDDYCHHDERWHECEHTGKPDLCFCPDYIFNKKSSLYEHENSYLYLGKTEPDDTFDKQEALEDLTSLEATYQSSIADMFHNSLLNVAELPEFAACKEVFSYYNTEVMTVIYNIFDWFEGIFDPSYKYSKNAMYFDEFIGLVANMTDSMKAVGLAGGYTALYETMHKCTWPNQYSYFHNKAKTNAEGKGQI